MAIAGAMVQVRVPPSPSPARSKDRSVAPASRQPVAVASSFAFASSTKWFEVTPADPAAVVVGDCVTALGPSSTTGAVAARTLSLRPAGPNGCFDGLGAGAASGRTSPLGSSGS
ncbi:MAG: hypothetical protein ACYCTL_13015 [Acidimicrobiales bacterium]